MKGVKIRLADGFVLEGIESFPFEINSIMLGENGFEGNFTYSMKVPLTDNNRVALKFSDVHEVSVNFDLKYECWVSSDQNEYQAYFKILTVEPKSASVSVVFDSGYGVEKLNTTNIADIDLGVLPFIESEVRGYLREDYTLENESTFRAYVGLCLNKASEYSDEDLSTALVCFPFYWDYQFPGSEYWDAWPNTNFKRRNNFKRNTYASGTSNEKSGFSWETDAPSRRGFKPVGLQPCIYIVNTLKLIFASLGFELKGNWMNYPFMDRLIHMPDKDFIEKVIYDLDIARDILAPAGGYQRWQMYPAEIQVNKYLPKVTVSQLVIYLRNHFFLNVTGNFFKKEIYLDFFEQDFLKRDYNNLTSSYAKWVDKKQDFFDGYEFGYDHSVEPLLDQKLGYSHASLFDGVDVFSDFTYKGEVGVIEDLPNVGIAAEVKKEYYYVTSLKKYYLPYIDLGSLRYRPTNFLQGQTSAKKGFSRECILPGNMMALWNSLETVTMVGPVASLNTGHNKLRLAHFTGRVSEQEPAPGEEEGELIERGFSYYSANTTGRANQAGEPINLINRPGWSYYTQFADFPTYSLFINSREGNNTPHENKPGMFDLFGKQYSHFCVNLLRMRFKMRLEIFEALNLKMNQKQIIGNNLYLIEKITGNAPVFEEMEMEAIWVPTEFYQEPDYEYASGQSNQDSGSGGGSSGLGGSSSSSGPGSPGPAGNGIASEAYDAATGIWTFTFTDGTTYSTGDLRGAPGSAGPPGSFKNGSNYKFVIADGTPDENEAEFRAQYAAAAALTPNGSAISNTNRVAVVVAPGYINLTAGFDLTAECVDIIALSGNVFFTGANAFNIVANDVNIKGITFECPSLLADNLNLLKMEDCTAGNRSFGDAVTVSGTFINCVGGNESFAHAGNASGTFINCVGGGLSFSNSGDASGTFINCVGGDSSFGKAGAASGYFKDCKATMRGFGRTVNASGTFINCESSGGESFGGGGGSITGKLFGCILEGANFIAVSGGGITRNGINGDFTPDNQG